MDDHSDEAERSQAAIENMPEPLRIAAIISFTTSPEADVAGLLVEDGVPLPAGLALDTDHPLPTDPKGTCGLVPRPYALEIVRQQGGPAAFEMATELAKPEEGKLFVVVLTPNGMRLGKVLIWMPQPSDPSEVGPDFGAFLLGQKRNEELKLFREGIEKAKVNPVKPGKYFQRLVSPQDGPGGPKVERIKLFSINLNDGNIVITESSAGKLYARKVITVDSVG